MLTHETQAVTRAGEETEAAFSIWPTLPGDVSGLGLTPSFLHDLILKHLSYSGPLQVDDLAQRLGLTYTLLASTFDWLWHEQLVDSVSSGAYLPQQMRFRLTERGQERAREALAHNRYAGPAPVPYQQYVETVEAQQRLRSTPHTERLSDALSELVFAPGVRRSLTMALRSGRPTLLYGPPGNGKTAALQAFSSVFEDYVLIPSAIYVQGQVIRVYDPVTHEPGPRPEALPGKPRLDGRWMLVRRPVIRIGGELGPETLDLAFDPGTGFYQAPAQVRAQHGTLILDDIGRQRIAAETLINRWIVAMERGADEITQPSGEVFTIPFDVRLIFSTALEPSELMSEAFLRRIPYKVHIPDPGPDELSEIVRRACIVDDVAYRDEGLEHLLSKAFTDLDQPVRAVAPWDLVGIVRDIATFDGRPAELTPELIDEAWTLYFLTNSYRDR